ncbi:unnamed protein product [Alopecurus aequalis]
MSGGGGSGGGSGSGSLKGAEKGKQKEGNGGRDDAAGRSGGADDALLNDPSGDDGVSYAWSHGIPYHRGFKCNYCGLAAKSGGVSRLKVHLAGVKGDARPCSVVPARVRRAMLRSVSALRVKQRAKERRTRAVERDVLMRMTRGRAYEGMFDEEEDDVRRAMEESLMDFKYRERVEQRGGRYEHGSSSSGSGLADGKRVKKGFDSDLARAMAPVQTRIDTVWSGKENKEMLAIAWSKWFQARDIPARKADCPYFVGAVKLTQRLGEGVPIPKSAIMDGFCLNSNYNELKEYVEQFTADWRTYGVTIMSDAWTGPTDMSIINFLIFCNGRMLFHKSVNPTGEMQNAKYLCKIIREVVVDEVGPEHVVQLVTDNGSNFKKACLMVVQEFPHIVWQPCCAHTVNLMLKDISKFDEVTEVVTSAKRISKFFHSHTRLHETMRTQVGGEIIQPNATRFGTQFVFLQSFMDKKDAFQKWMVSDDWKNSEWSSSPDYDYTYDNLVNRQWWNKMKWVLDAVTPIYKLLRYADREKNATISGFIPTQCTTSLEMSELFKGDDYNYNRFFDVLNKRLRMMRHDSHLVAAGILDPAGDYEHMISAHPELVKHLSESIRRISTSPESTVEALRQFEAYRNRRGIFGTEEARMAAKSLTPASWWMHYGADYRELQKYALRIVSQCMSSSGCERNWSTFALIHTLLRNRLGYEKLHKLVYVHYNLKLRIQQQELDMKESEIDPLGIVMDTALFDRDNPIMDWLYGSMSNAKPIFNEKDDGMFEREINLAGSLRNGKCKIICSDDETQSQPSSPYENDNIDEVAQTAATTIDEVAQTAAATKDGEEQFEKIQFTCEQNFTHATQDQDHGSRQSRPQRKAPSKFRRMSDLSDKRAAKKKMDFLSNWKARRILATYIFCVKLVISFGKLY